MVDPLIDGAPVKLRVPERVSVRGAQNGALLLTPEEDWATFNGSATAGSLVIVSLDELAKRAK